MPRSTMDKTAMYHTGKANDHPENYNPNKGHESDHKGAGDSVKQNLDHNFREAVDHVLTEDQKTMVERLTDRLQDPTNFSEKERKDALEGTLHAFNAMDFGGNRNAREGFAEKIADAHMHHFQSHVEKETHEAHQLLHPALDDWLQKHKTEFSVVDGAAVFKVSGKERRELELIMQGAGLEVRTASREERDAYKYDRNPAEDGKYYMAFELPKDDAGPTQESWLEEKQRLLDKTKDEYKNLMLRDDLSLDEQVDAMNLKLWEAHRLSHMTQDRKEKLNQEEDAYSEMRTLHFQDQKGLQDTAKRIIDDAWKEPVDGVLANLTDENGQRFTGFDKMIQQAKDIGERSLLEAVARNDQNLAEFLIAAQGPRAATFAGLLESGINYPEGVKAPTEWGNDHSNPAHLLHDIKMTIYDMHRTPVEEKHTFLFKTILELAKEYEQGLNEIANTTKGYSEERDQAVSDLVKELKPLAIALRKEKQDEDPSP